MGEEAGVTRPALLDSTYYANLGSGAAAKLGVHQAHLALIHVYCAALRGGGCHLWIPTQGGCHCATGLILSTWRTLSAEQLVKVEPSILAWPPHMFKAPPCVKWEGGCLFCVTGLVLSTWRTLSAEQLVNVEPSTLALPFDMLMAPPCVKRRGGSLLPRY